MNGLLRRLTRRRAATADETPPDTPAASEPVDATVISSQEERPPMSEEEQELRRRRRDLPAGLDPDRLEEPAGESARRGAVRRRVRYLRSAREVLIRDLGGFYYEVHRAGGGHRQLLETKASRLAAIDEELRELESRLGEPRRAETVVRQPGVGGSCPSCGELHGSDAAWCAHCGTPLSDRARKRREQEVDRTIAARQAEAADRARETAANGGSPGAARGDAATPGDTATTGGTASPGDTGDTATTGATPRDAERDEAPTSELAAWRGERPS